MSFLDTIGLTRKITRPRIRVFLEKYATDAKTLDIGCGSAQYRDLFPNVTTFDLVKRQGVNVDVVGDAHDLHMFPDGSFDVILCTEVLEHLHTPSKALAEMQRVLKSNGVLLLTTRFIFPLHDTPGDYYRYTEYGLRHLLRDFEVVEFREEAGTMETLAVLYQRIGFQCETLRFRPFKIIWFLKALILRHLGWMLTREYGDIHCNRPEKSILCSGYYVAARRRAQ